MPAAGMAEIAGPASAAGRGVGAFNIIGIEHAEAVIAGAEAARAPVVLAISQNCVAYHGALEPLARAALAAAGSAAVPVAVHLDHATDEDLVRAAVAAGLGSVMYDASAAPYEQNVRATAAVARWCHERGVDEDLIAEIHRAVPVPLVLHGSSGVADAGLAAAVAAGMTKINIATQLNKAFTGAVRACLAADPALVDPRRYGAAARDAVATEVTRLLGVLRAAR